MCILYSQSEMKLNRISDENLLILTGNSKPKLINNQVFFETAE